MQFVDEHCLIFDTNEESSLEYTAARSPRASRAAAHAVAQPSAYWARRSAPNPSTWQVHEKFKDLVDRLLSGAASRPRSTPAPPPSPPPPTPAPAPPHRRRPCGAEPASFRTSTPHPCTRACRLLSPPPATAPRCRQPREPPRSADPQISCRRSASTLWDSSPSCRAWRRRTPTSRRRRSVHRGQPPLSPLPAPHAPLHPVLLISKSPSRST